MMKGRSGFSSLHGVEVEEEGSATTARFSKEEKVEWEMRPGGMLVQRRTDQVDKLSPVKNVLVRVAFGALRFQISVNSQATFGELKKLLTVETRLEAGEQKLIFRGKERENGEYLDMCGVKDKSKVVLMEDPTSREKRFIEMRRNAKIQTARRAVFDVSDDVDRLAQQVATMEKSISNKTKVAEIQITTLMEMLMLQAIKLDNISTQGTDSSSEKKLQTKRVQKYVEKLDVLKVENERVKPVVATTATGAAATTTPATEWETFEFDVPTATTTATPWEIFD